MNKPKKLIAYCWSTGRIDFGYELPEGAIAIAEGDEATVRDEIEVTARLAYDNKTLLVPGVPEAPDQRAGLEALARHIQRLSTRNGPGFRALGV